MKRLLFKLLRYSGLPVLFRELIQRRRVTILMFHDIGAGAAERAFGYLAKRYRFIGLDDYLAARRGELTLPPKALVITFDDGHAGNYNLLPLFRRLRIPVTIFLCAGIINTRRHYWFTVRHPRVSTSAMKQLPNAERLRLLAEAGFHPELEYETPQALDRAQIGEMRGAVNFQAHTILHPCLPMCDDEEAAREIAGSKAALEQHFGLAVNAMAYPNGDYSDRDAELARQAGYACAVTVDYGFNTLKTDPFRLKRLSANDTDNLDELAVKASGLWGFFKPWTWR